MRTLRFKSRAFLAIASDPKPRTRQLRSRNGLEQHIDTLAPHQVREHQHDHVRIRNAKIQKLPYVLVVGDDDVADGTLGVNPRGGEVERGVPLEDFVARLAAEVAERR